MLVTGKEIMDAAHAGNYAVGAFNTSNLEITQAIISAAEEAKAPVIIQTSESAIKYAGFAELAGIVRTMGERAKVPVALHLDHGATWEILMGCLRHGWTSIMFDGSHYALAENIEKTAEIVKIAHAMGVSVEAELGRLSGVEDNISVTEKDAIYTNPAEAKKFTEESGIDFLAVAIGTAHGIYKAEPKLDFDRLAEIRGIVDIPLVLHGASGVPADAIKIATSNGINKINIDTDIRCAFAADVRETLAADAKVYDPRKILGKSRDAMKAVVLHKMELFGCVGKA